MIEELHLKNCQSHKDSILKFSPGLNIITGDTDSGKSAIIRGLDKICYNSMTSKELISHWSKSLFISIVVDNHKLELKNEGKDVYTLDDTPFKASGGKVPEEIQNIINMDDINFQNQIDSFFLLDETSGYVASYLNQIANLSQIDSTTKSIKSELNETKRTILNDKGTLQGKEEVLESYSYLTLLATAIKEADELEENKSALELEINAIGFLADKIEKIDSKLNSNQKILSLKPIVDSAIATQNELGELEQKVKRIDTLLTNLELIDANIKKLSNLITLKPLFSDIKKLEKKQSVLNMKLEGLDDYISILSNIERRLKTAHANRLQEQSKYDSEFKKLDVCFVCGSKLN